MPSGSVRWTRGLVGPGGGVGGQLNVLLAALVMFVVSCELWTGSVCGPGAVRSSHVTQIEKQT